MAKLDLRKERLKRGWTLEDLSGELADRGIDASITALSRYERGVQVPRPGLRAQLAEFFGVDVDDFERSA